MIYLDQAATSYPKPPKVGQAMCETLHSAGNSGRGAHHFSLAASRIAYGARAELAAFFGAENPSCIAFTANATESLNLALSGVLNPGDHVITTELEHNSVLRPLYILENTGVEVTILPATRAGNVDFPSLLPEQLRPNTKAIVVTHASNVTGSMIDMEYVGEFCQERGLIFILDAAQTAGFYSYELKKSPIDILCFTGHKGLYGPQGVGGIYVKPGITVRPLKVGGSGIQTFSRTHPSQMPEALEAGTLNLPGIAGLRAGVDYVKNVGLHRIRQQEWDLTSYFHTEVTKIPGVEVYGDFSSPQRCPIVALNIHGFESSLMSQALAEEFSIYTRSGGHCAPLMHGALGTGEMGALRFSFSHLNTREELETTLGALRDLSSREWEDFL
ncbi:MAG: aminotransferase class V-fold PLP-dependent enzyme [Limnochordia bacterium]|nr:aminotransferase class V-fold PLP-dependent enzyme [Limnochordia bacterium]